MRTIAIFLAMLAAAATAQWQSVNVNKVTLEGTMKDGGTFEVKVDSDVPKQIPANILVRPIRRAWLFQELA